MIEDFRIASLCGTLSVNRQLQYGGNGMEMFEVVLAGIIAPAALVLIWGRACRVTTGGLAPGMVVSGIGSLAVAAVVAHFVVEPGVTMASRYWTVLPALPMIQLVATVLLAEALKIWSLRWSLDVTDDLTWRRFAILAGWTGAGFAAAETCLHVFRHGDDAMLLRSLAIAPLHVLNAIIGAALLWRGVQHGSRLMTIAAIGVSAGLHVLFTWLAAGDVLGGWGIPVAVLAMLVPSAMLLVRPDNHRKATPVRKIPCNMAYEEIGITD